MKVQTDHYDYIICGAGCAGLSLAYRLCDDYFADRRVLIINKEPKNTNDRTWSFWVREGHIFDHIVHKRWPKINFYGEKNLPDLSTAPYQYQMIRGIDFYEHTLARISATSHIDIVYDEILSVYEKENSVLVKTRSSEFTADQVFDSVIKKFPVENKLFVWQHFKGWLVECAENSFDAEVATFMDFRIDQADDIRFVYVLPLSDRKALIEATVFSGNIEDSSFYNQILSHYCNEYLNLKDYRILEEEMGAIPMTTAKFHTKPSRNIIPIGTLNDTVKPSSGYAFTRIQRESDQIINQLKKTSRANKILKKGRFLAYDRTFLNVLLTKKENGRKVFSLLFQRNKVKNIFKFLDEETNLTEEMTLFKTLPIWSFTKAFFAENMSKKN